MTNGEFDFGDGAAARKPRKTPPVSVAPAAPPADRVAPPTAWAAGVAQAVAASTAPGAAGQAAGAPAEAPDAEAIAQAQASARKLVAAAAGIGVHVAGLDWQAIADELNTHGHAIVPGMLTADECVAMAAQYAQPQLYRNRVVMSQHGFGSGEYQYFRYPLPSMISALRRAPRSPAASCAVCARPRRRRNRTRRSS